MSHLTDEPQSSDNRLPNTQWGVSNVPPPMLEELLQLCEKNGWKKPTCYQGQYNLVTRGMETKLLPILRAHKISYNAFMYVCYRLSTEFYQIY